MLVSGLRNRIIHLQRLVGLDKIMAMKIDVSNPWGIIRWAVVACMFAACVLIAADQVKNRDALIKELETKVSKGEQVARDALRLAKESNDSGIKMSEAMLAGLNAAQNNLKETSDMGKVLGSASSLVADRAIELEEENTRLKEEVSRLKIAISSMTRTSPQVVQQPITRATSNTGSAGESDPPWWQPPSRRTVDAAIRDAANAKWKDDYQMVEYQIKTESEAYEKLLQYNKDYRPDTKRIIAKAVQRWGSDWSMVVYEIETQTEAKSRLQSSR